MEPNFTLDLAIVRNRLLAGKFDSRDEALLTDALEAAIRMSAKSPYANIVSGAIANALSDASAGAMEAAACEVNLVHNVPIGGDWATAWDEEYFLKAAVLTYVEQAPVERIKALFARFA
ncbi:MAG: hypothetical protein JNL62_19510 [Bryobacterales bacterium]|nr:hypothetical protein [Bryobacterales bacterium]